MFIRTRCRLDAMIRDFGLWLVDAGSAPGRAILRGINKDPFRVWQDTGESDNAYLSYECALMGGTVCNHP